VGSSIAETEECAWVGEELKLRVQGVVGVVEQREVEKAPTIELHQCVVRDLLGASAGALGDCSHAVFKAWLVAEVSVFPGHKHLVPALGNEISEIAEVDGLIFDDSLAYLWLTELDEPFLWAELVEREVGQSIQKGMPCPFPAQNDSDASACDLSHDARVGALEALEPLSPELRVGGSDSG
jgi:hypothetical protein